MNRSLLSKVAKLMVSSGKGILAMDESHGTCKKRFDAHKIEFNEDNRRAYREMLIATKDLGNYISGAILFDETLRQKTSSGAPFCELLEKQGILTGIKVDTGTKDMALHPGEKITEGLDGLRERLAEYKNLKAVFAKWRAVITIGNGIPTKACMKANGHTLARYASLCQEADIVPIVEPEVLMDGDHTIDACYEAMAQALTILFEEIVEQGVLLEGVILKASMVIPGKGSGTKADYKEVAAKTVKCLKENVPANLAGIVFLSGGQADEDSTLHLNEMNKSFKNLSWPLSFSYGRALQAPALKAWAYNTKDLATAQAALLRRAKFNSLATLGKYEISMEK